MRKSIENNNDVVREQVPGHRFANILLSEEALPELERGALDMGFAHPIKLPAPIAQGIVHASQRIEVRFDAKAIAGRIEEIANAISKSYLDSERQLVVVGVLKGCSPFISDLLRAMDQRLLMEVDFIEIGHGGHLSKSLQQPHIRLPQVDMEGKDVLVVDDILDTGTTLNRVIGQIYAQRPRSIDACVLVEKTAHRCEAVPELKHRGFTLKSGWAVGYGMDYKQYYRNLPYVGVLKSRGD